MSIHETPWPPGTPCWIDIAVPDVPLARLFYSSVLGWTFVDTGDDFAHYTVCQKFGHAAAAIGPVLQEAQPSAWTVYLASDDCDSTAKMIVDSGGTLLVAPTDISDNGRMCVALDPTGCVFGVWESIETIGIGIANEPGSLIWTDARLADADVGRAFYGAVFGHTFQPVPGAPDGYSTFAVDGAPRGGMGGMLGNAAGSTPHWLAYFAVDDVDATVADAELAGGAILDRPQDTSFGRTAMIVDPFGARFGVIGSSVRG